MTCVFIRFGHRQAHTERPPCEDENRDAPKMTNKPLEAKREAWSKFSLIHFRVTNLDLRLLAFRLVTQ